MSDDSAVPWRRLGVEMFAIVASVLLALAANEWWEGREDRQRAREAVVQFRAELQQNRDAVADALEYHRSMRERVSGLVERVSEGESYDPREEGPPLSEGFSPPVPRSTAWRTATATGALQELDYLTVSRISDAYTMQEVVAAQFDRILQGFMRPETFEAGPSTGLLRFVLVGMNDIVSIEEGLLEAYDRALTQLEAEAPAPARPGSGTSVGPGDSETGADSATAVP